MLASDWAQKIIIDKHSNELQNWFFLVCERQTFLLAHRRRGTVHEEELRRPIIASDRILACVAWRFWLGALSNKGRRGQRNREEIGAEATWFLFFSRLRLSFSRASRANFAATPLLRPARQNRHATQANRIPDRFCVISMEFLSLSRRLSSSRNVSQRR